MWVYVQYMNLKYLQGAYSCLCRAGLLPGLKGLAWLTETAVDKSKFLAQRWHTLLVDLSLYASLTIKFSIVVEIKT